MGRSQRAGSFLGVLPLPPSRPSGRLAGTFPRSAGNQQSAGAFPRSAGNLNMGLSPLRRELVTT